jgi:hypothetical protein
MSGFYEQDGWQRDWVSLVGYNIGDIIFNPFWILRIMKNT